MQTEKAQLATGFLEANIAHTRARYARPRSLVEKPKSPRAFQRGIEKNWGN
jgi:hypothetical protein